MVQHSIEHLQSDARLVGPDQLVQSTLHPTDSSAMLHNDWNLAAQL